MVNTIAGMLNQVKERLPELVSQPVNEYLGQHPDFIWRNRRLNPLNIVMMFITQIMHENTAISNLRHVAGMTVTPTAYCKARMRLPLALIEYVSQWLSDQLVGISDQVCQWRGHRVWLGDGTSFSMPACAAAPKTFWAAWHAKRRVRVSCSNYVSTM